MAIFQSKTAVAGFGSRASLAPCGNRCEGSIPEHLQQKINVVVQFG